jgi:hypothetical protein
MRAEPPVRQNSRQHRTNKRSPRRVEINTGTTRLAVGSAANTIAARCLSGLLGRTLMRARHRWCLCAVDDHQQFVRPDERTVGHAATAALTRPCPRREQRSQRGSLYPGRAATAPARTPRNTSPDPREHGTDVDGAVYRQGNQAAGSAGSSCSRTKALVCSYVTTAATATTSSTASAVDPRITRSIACITHRRRPARTPPLASMGLAQAPLTTKPTPTIVSRTSAPKARPRH